MARRMAWLERWVAVAVVTVAATGVVVATVPPEPAAAAVVRPFALNYADDIYGDVITVGNGNMTCPGPSDPTDPQTSEPKTTCGPTQERTYTGTYGVNDAYYMRWADVDSDSASYNSSRARVTIPAGATVELARLSWTGTTGTFRLADGTISTSPGCNTRQFLQGAGSSVVPSGTPESTSVRVTVGSGSTSTVAPQVISRDALASVPSGQPQYYSAYATVTDQLTSAATGSPTVINVGNVWAPRGFGCHAGWSLNVIYSFPGPTAAAPELRSVRLYDGHVRQTAADPSTQVAVDGLQVGTGDVRVGVFAADGELNLIGDAFYVNGVPQVEPQGTATNNFFTSSTDGATSPSVANNLSVDAKSWSTTAVPTGATTAALSVSSSGDAFLAQTLTFSAPRPGLHVDLVETSTGPYRPGHQISFQVVATATSDSFSAAQLEVPGAPDCTQTRPLVAGVPQQWSCTATAPADDTTFTATLSGRSSTGVDASHSDSVATEVINPDITITKTADRDRYLTGETITFAIDVENTGDTPLYDIEVTDPKVPDCDITWPSLAAGASADTTCTTTAPIADGLNSAFVTAVDVLDGVVDDADTALAPSFGSISGRVISDRGDDGTFDPDEGDTGIHGAPIALIFLDFGNGEPEIISTAPDGTFSFGDLIPGSYLLIGAQPSAFDDGIDTPGTRATIAANDQLTITLPNLGDSSEGTVFAEIPTSSISGSVFEDADGDGAHDTDEDGIGGVTVELTGIDEDDNPVSHTAVTEDDGTYAFDRLRAGTYTVTETQPTGYRDGVVTAGTAGGTVGADTVSEIVLPARTAATGYTFAETVASSLSGTVTDDHGTGIADVTVTLSGPGGGDTTTTDEDGAWSFPGLAPGTYEVSAAQPAGYADGPETVGTAGGEATGDDAIVAIVIASDTEATGYRFTERSSSLAGEVFDDVDGDGVREAGDTGIEGVTITLSGTDAADTPVERTTSTDEDGAYSFTGLRGGTYTVTETQPDGYLDGLDTVGTSGGTAAPPDAIEAIDLGGGIDATRYRFSHVRPASLSGTVTDTLDNPIRDVTMTLTGTTGSGVPVDVSTTSGANGAWTFTDLHPGEYVLTQTQPDGYTDDLDHAGTAGGYPGPRPGFDAIEHIFLSSGTDATGYRFTDRRGQISGSVFHDLDADGLRERGEPGIDGVTITLTGTDAHGDPVDLTTTTITSGAFTFDQVIGGSYTLTQTQPDGYMISAVLIGEAGGARDGDHSIVDIDLGGGQFARGYVFAQVKASGIDGTVVDDVGRPLADVEVTVTGSDDLGDPVSDTTSTDADGRWSFPALRPGTYTITETQPVGYGTGSATSGTAGGTADGDVISGIVLGSSDDADGYVFTDTTASLAGRVVDDPDGDGIVETGDAGIEGVTVTLTGTDDRHQPVDVTTETDADGTYAFHGLLSGTYTVTETQPETYLDGPDTAGSAGGTPTPPDSISGIVLDPGEDATGYLFTDSRASVLSGTVVDDAGTGIEDVTVTLTGTTGAGDPVSRSTETGPTGAWSFAGVLPGTYTVTETQPPGYGDGPDTAGTAGGTVEDDVISGIVLTSGTSATGYTFTEGRGSLAGIVFVDVDGDGQRDPGEDGIADVELTVTGTDARGAAVDRTVTTGDDGAFAVAGLVGGDYALAQAQPDGYADGIDTPGTAGGSAVAPDTIEGISLAAGQDATGYTFGEQPGAVTGTVFIDRDGDGAIAPEEGGRIEGVVVTLLAGEVEVAATATAADGTYTLPGLPAGTFTVRATQPEGYGSTTPDEVEVLLSAGEGRSVDFGDRLGSIGDRVFADDDGDGLQDEGEAGIADIAVTLLAADGDEVATTATDADGHYRFTDLAVGSYVVAVDGGDDLVPTTPLQGADPALDSDVDQATGRTGPVDVVLADLTISQLTEVDAGLVARVDDLAVSLEVGPAVVGLGDVVTATATAIATGSSVARGAQLVVTVPDALDLTVQPDSRAAGGDGWTCTVTDGTATCTTDEVLLPGTALPVTVTAEAVAADDGAEVRAEVSFVDGTTDDAAPNDVAVATVAIAADPIDPPGPTDPTDPSAPGPGGGGGSGSGSSGPLARTGTTILPTTVVGLGLLLGGLALQRRRRRLA